MNVLLGVDEIHNIHLSLYLTVSVAGLLGGVSLNGMCVEREREREGERERERERERKREGGEGGREGEMLVSSVESDL